VIGRDRRYAPRDGYFDFFSREMLCILREMNQERLAELGISPTDETLYVPQYKATSYVGDRPEYPFLVNIITLISLGPFSAAANMPTLLEICGMTVGETWDSWLEMNPEAAGEIGLHDKDEVWVESPFGKVKTKVRFVKGLRPDVVNLPHNLGHTAGGRFARNRGVNGLELLNPDTEPVTGLASFTNTRVKVYRA
jgi:hypothetical protein